MSFAAWMDLIRSAEKASFLSGKIRKVHYKFPDGKEMAEEYSMETGVIQRRAWKKSKTLMGDSQWDIEMGETIHDPTNENAFTFRESITEPVLLKRITKKNIEWRIRNLPYPIDNYNVTADREKKSIVVRTNNKKYFKTINVPELDRCQTLPEQDNISIHHQYNTLIITYKKPQIVCDMETETLKILQEVETETDMEDLMQSLLAK